MKNKKLVINYEAITLLLSITIVFINFIRFQAKNK